LVKQVSTGFYEGVRGTIYEKRITQGKAFSKIPKDQSEPPQRLNGKRLTMAMKASEGRMFPGTL